MDKEKAKENRMIQQFFKNKVFWGIDSVPLKRKSTEVKEIRMDLEKMNASM